MDTQNQDPKGAPRFGRSRPLLLFGGILLALALIVGLNMYRMQQKGGVAVKVAVVQEAPIKATVYASGRVAVPKQEEIIPLSGGLVRKVAVQRGEMVSLGQILIELEDDELCLAIRQAEANLALAQANLSRALEDTAPNELARAEEAVHQAKASWENAQQRLSRALGLFAEGIVPQQELETLQLEENLFGRSEAALENKVILRKVPVTVVGILKEQEGMLGGGGNQVYLPLRFWQQLFNTNRVDQLEASAISKDQVEASIDKTLSLLHRRHKNTDRYRAFNMEKEMEAANQAMGILTTIISAIAGISLVVGGIGVMNIMLVSVTERTREIGLRMALGARRQDVLRQFLIEAVALSMLGGLLGMVLGIGGSMLMALALKIPPFFSWTPVILAFTFSALIGIFFGIYPANKAARLDPIEALRYE